MSRRPTPVRLAVLAGLSAACLLAAAAPGHAQQQAKLKVPSTGTQIFSHLLHGFNLKPLKSVADLADLTDVEVKDTLVVVFGSLKVLDDIKKRRPGGLAKFHADGGAVLVASDRPDRLGRLADFKVRIGTHPYLECPPPDLKHAYKKDRRVLFLPTAIGIHHPLFVGLRKGLAAHYPSSLERADDCDLQSLCVYPTAWYLESGGQSVVLLTAAPFIVGTANDSAADERLVIIPGHGMFMNGLMYQGDTAERDNDNYPFAVNCIRWLTDGGKRKRVLFVVENVVVTDLKLPLAPPPIPTARFVNALLRALEEENIFNQVLLTFVSKDTLLRTALIVGSVLLLVLALGRFLRGRLPVSKELLLSRRVARQQAAPPLIVQRHWDVLRRGNLWEAARVLARQCFEGVAARKPDAPPTAVRGAAEQRRRLDALVKRLWQLAYGTAARPVAMPEFALLLTVLDTVRAALADGTLLFPAALQHEPASGGRQPPESPRRSQGADAPRSPKP